jgi:putative oxidoreductase
MNMHASSGRWHVIAILAARLIFGGFFAMGAIFKFADIGGTAAYIASVGFPAPLLLAWLAAFLELALAICLLTGAFFTEAALLAARFCSSPSCSMDPRAGKATGRCSGSSCCTSP